MNKFKKGDVVECVDALLTNQELIEGNYYKVLGVDFPSIMVSNERGHMQWFHFPRFKPKPVDSYPNPKHKHHDLIIEWAKGAEIQYYSPTFKHWRGTTSPTWNGDVAYRVKPATPKTDKELITELEARIKELEGQQ